MQTESDNTYADSESNKCKSRKEIILDSRPITLKLSYARRGAGTNNLDADGGRNTLEHACSSTLRYPNARQVSSLFRVCDSKVVEWLVPFLYPLSERM